MGKKDSAQRNQCTRKAQAHGELAQKFAHALVHGKIVTIVEYGEDRYKCVIGDVVLEDGTILNKELVRAGSA